jgi:hypothetical protein
MRETTLRHQIEAWYMTVTGKDSPLGALKWCADQLGVLPQTVERWFTDSPTERRRLTNQARAGLRLLEQLVVLRHGQRAVDRALRQRRRRG